MDAQQLLAASTLDILFEGRNKEYGAYTLRKGYNQRLQIAMLSMAILVTLFIILSSFRQNKDQNQLLVITDTFHLEPPPVEDEPEPIPPPKPIEPPQPVKPLPFTAPQIVHEEDFRPEEAPPPVDELINARIDLFKSDGIDAVPGFVPPQGLSEGIIGGVSELKEDKDSIYIRVEIESTYPGGPKAWARFLNKTLVYPEKAVINETQGTVLVGFVVDTDGAISRVEAISGPEELTQEAIRVIKKSGKWTPAIQNGRTVKSYKKQPLSFRLAEE